MGGDNAAAGVVKGAYEPVGKVDIAAIRRQARETGTTEDERPKIVKGSYEPVGKVDIAAIRARAQKPLDTSSPAQDTIPRKSTGGSDKIPDEPRSHTDPSAAFATSERLTSLPKPKVSNRFGGGSAFIGTKAPTPGGFEQKTAPAAAPVGTASRTFADQGGKTPAQIWAEKKARERGQSGSGDNIPPSSATLQSPIAPQTSGGGEWKSGYSGKSWAPVQTTHTGKSAGSSIGQQRTGEMTPEAEEDALQSPAGGISSIRDRFSGAPPMGAPATSFERSAPEPDVSNKPNRGMGIPIPGLPRPENEDDRQAPSMPSPPPQPPRSPTPPTPEMRSASPIRVARPVGRGTVTDVREEQTSPAPIMPVRSIEQAMPEPEDDEPETGPDPGRAAAQATAAASLGTAGIGTTPHGGQETGKKALVQYDYEKAENNEIELKEGEYVTNIEMVDEDWWMGQNVHGDTGLFPSNYVELVEDDEEYQTHAAPRAQSHASEPTPPSAVGGGLKADPTATALYDYEAAGEYRIDEVISKAWTNSHVVEDNELPFPEGAKITNLVRPSSCQRMI